MTGIILAHNKAAAAVARHRPTWEAVFEQTIIISPWDDHVPGSIPMGSSEKIGRGCIERMMFAATLASRFERAAIVEYDTVFFGNGFTQKFPVDGVLACSRAWLNDDPLFTAQAYGHSPWIATGETWWKIICAGADFQHGVPDRWLALAAERAGVGLREIQYAYSEDRKWSDKTLMEAVIHRMLGGIVVHGIKNEWELDALKNINPCKIGIVTT